MSRFITAITLLPANRHSPVAVDGGQLAVLSALFVLGSVSCNGSTAKVTTKHCYQSSTKKKIHNRLVISCDTKMSFLKVF